MPFGQSSAEMARLCSTWHHTAAVDVGCGPRRLELGMWLEHLPKTFSCGCLAPHTMVAESQGWESQERPRGNHIGFYDQGLESTQCYLCCTPFPMTTLPRLKGRENRFYLLVADSRRTCGIKILVSSFRGNTICYNGACHLLPTCRVLLTGKTWLIDSG